MRDLHLLAVQLLIALAKRAPPGGARSLIAESLLLKQQLLISRRSRRRAPPPTTIDRFVLGLMTLFVRPRRVVKVATILKPATLLRFHKALVDLKYRRLFSSAVARSKPGPKGPTQEIISPITEMKHRNPRFGYQRIAQQISHAFAPIIPTARVPPGSLSSRRPRTASGAWTCFVASRSCFAAIGSLCSSMCSPAASSDSAS